MSSPQNNLEQGTQTMVTFLSTQQAYLRHEAGRAKSDVEGSLTPAEGAAGCRPTGSREGGQPKGRLTKWSAGQGFS